MAYRILADLVVVVHLGFILFVVVGGRLVLRWRSVMWLHLPAVVWGVLLELAGWTCPLTPLENWLRNMDEEAGYQGSFIEHYLLAILYPEGLTRTLQMALGFVALAVNLLIYRCVFSRTR
jgi:hypothetical protein